MNAMRRKALVAINDALEAAKSALEELQSEEQNYYDNMPESFQNGDKGQKASETADTLQTAVDGLDEAISSISNVTE